MLDTSAVVAGTRSASGASNQLLEAALTGLIRPLISVPLVLEYEAVLKRPEQLRASRLTLDQVDVLLQVLIATGIEVTNSFRWRPQLADPGDEMVLETAINGAADAIVSYNRRDFLRAASRFGIEILSPYEAWKRVKRP